MQGRFSLSPSLFNYSLVFIHILGHKLILSLFCCSNYSSCGLWGRLQAGPFVLWTCSPHPPHPLFFFIQHFLIQVLQICSGFILYFPHFRIQNSSFLWGACFLLLENGVQNLRSFVRCVHYYWGVLASRPSQWTDLENGCIITQEYTRTYISVCFYLNIGK